jgi:hypothetical protein
MGRKNSLGVHLTGHAWDTVWSARGYGPASAFAEAHPELELTPSQVGRIWNGQTRRPGWIQERTTARRPTLVPCTSVDALRNRCGLTTVEQVRLYDAQGGTCFLGEHPIAFADARMEHDHTHAECDGKGCPACVRGLACSNCNLGIGYFQDDPDRMRVAATNLEIAIKKTRASWAA